MLTTEYHFWTLPPSFRGGNQVAEALKARSDLCYGWIADKDPRPMFSRLGYPLVFNSSSADVTGGIWEVYDTDNGQVHVVVPCNGRNQVSRK